MPWLQTSQGCTATWQQCHHPWPISLSQPATEQSAHAWQCCLDHCCQRLLEQHPSHPGTAPAAAQSADQVLEGAIQTVAVWMAPQHWKGLLPGGTVQVRTGWWLHAAHHGAGVAQGRLPPLAAPPVHAMLSNSISTLVAGSCRPRQACHDLLEQCLC